MRLICQHAAIVFAALASMANGTPRPPQPDKQPSQVEPQLPEDLASATTPLPPGTFTTSAHSDRWKVANALSAGPASITEHATVIDWPANPSDGMSHGRAPMVGPACRTFLGDLSTTQCAWTRP
jgi:hypothetical protein